MRRYFVFIMATIIMASCGSTPEEIPDWCYIYDFTTDDYDFNIADGQWIDEIGLQTDDGLLSFSYEHDVFVTPVIIYVTVERPVGITGTIDISTAGTVYGISTAFSVGMPTDEETVHFTPAIVGDAGKTINVTLDVGSQELNITQIEVQGNGATPFDDNPCDRITPSPTFTPSPTVPSTNTPFPTGEATYTPSPTFTPTETPTPTDTPEGTLVPTNTLDPDPSPTPDPYCDNLTCIYDHYEYSDAEINAQQWGYTRTTEAGQSGLSGGIDGGQRAGNACAGPNCEHYVIMYYELLDNVVVERLQGWVKNDDGWALYDGDVNVTIGFYDEFENYGGTCFLESFDDLQGWYEFDYDTTGCTGYDNARKIRVAIGNTRGGHLTLSAVTQADNLKIVFSEAYDPPPTYTPYEPSRTPIATVTPGEPSRTPVAYNSPTPLPTLNLTQVSGTSVALSMTPQPSTPTYYPSLTYVPSGTPYSTAVAGEGTPTPSVEEIRENEAEYEILEEMKDNQNWIENVGGAFVEGISSAFEWVFQGFNDIFSLIYGFISFFLALIESIFEIMVEILGIIFLIIQLMLGLLSLLLMYIGQAIARLTALISSFFTAPAIPIPGLPLCVSSPLDHDLCAIYYILDWTLFAPQTPGQYLVPLVWTLMNIVIIFRAVWIILRFIKRGEDVTR